MEKYSFTKAGNEAAKVRGKAKELLLQRGEEGEPAKEDYQKAEELLENKQYGLESQKKLIQFAKRKAKKIFPGIDANEFQSVREHLFFPVVDQYFRRQPIIDSEFIKKLRSGGKILSVGVRGAQLEELLFKGFNISRESITLADNEFLPEAEGSDLPKIQFDMREKWPGMGHKFNYIIFPESFGILRFKGIEKMPNETHRFFPEVGEVVQAVFSNAIDDLSENLKEFVLDLMEQDIPALKKKYFIMEEALDKLEDEGELRFSGDLMSKQEVAYVALKAKEKYGRNTVEVIFSPYLRIIKHKKEKPEEDSFTLDFLYDRFKKELPDIQLREFAKVGEGKEQLKYTIWMVSQSKKMLLALRGVLSLFKEARVEIYSDIEKLLKDLEQGKDLPDLVNLGDFLDPDMQEYEQEKSIRVITQIRNNPHVGKQPVILKISFNKKVLEKCIQAGADFAFDAPSFKLIDFLLIVTSVPELINNLETQYGKKMLHSKQGFYKEYQDKLKERSGETADTEKELEILENIFREHGARNILDAGMGEGRIAMPLIEKGYQVTGVDSSWDLVARAKNKFPEGEFIAGDLQALPVKDATQDAITYNWHVFADILGNQPKRQTLSEAHRVLREGGVIVLDLPDRESGDVQRDGIYIHNPGGERVFIGYVPTEEEMKRFLTEAGFGNIQVKKWETQKGFHKITFVGEKIGKSGKESK